MSFVKPVTDITFPANRMGYFYALSAKESSSNLKLPDYDPKNIKAQSKSNQAGYIGYFQFGESQLYEAGYFTISAPFSIQKNSPFQRSITVNDWKGTWTGKNGVKSKEQFLNGRRWQLDAIDFMHNLHCKRLRALGYNEFYGKIVKGIEITESGCCAGVHLVGLDAVRDFALGRSDKVDGNGTPVSHYIGLFAHYDMESCCNRKIYVQVKKDKQPVSGKKVTVETDYDGKKFHIGKITNDYQTDEEGKIPVIVRHPDAKIKITVDGKSTNIVQEADKKQSYFIDLTDGISVKAPLEKPSTPQPKPKPNQTPQEARIEQYQAQQTTTNTPKDVTFNIIIVEADTKKPITNLKFFTTYKGVARGKRTDDQGLVKGIVATTGQDIEISMQGDKSLQPIAHIYVTEFLEGKNVQVILPVENFTITVINYKNEPVKNTNFMIKYRGRNITKRTDNNGTFSTKMLLGFVYKFCLANAQELITRRCIKGLNERISINEVAFNLSQGKPVQVKHAEKSGIVDKMYSLVKYNPSSFSLSPPTPKPTSKPQQPRSSTQTQKSSAQKPAATSTTPVVKQTDTHTQNNGNPVTVITNKNTSSDKDLDGISIIFNIDASRKTEVSQKTIQNLKRLAKLAGRSKLVITSARRTPEEQAHAMYSNIKNGKIIRYAKPGADVTQIALNGIKNGLSKEQVINSMITRINFYDKQGVRVSRHCVSSSTYSTQNIVDLGNRSNGFSGTVARTFHNCCKQAVREGWVTKVISPLDDTAEPAFHIEIAQ